MENKVKFLTVKDVIKQLSELDPELQEAEVCFSEPNGEELLIVGIQNITILKSENEEGETATVVSIAGSLEAEDECNCPECMMEREGEVLNEEGVFNYVNGLYNQILADCGIKDWVGYNYFLEEFKDQMDAQGFEENEYKHLL